MIALFSQREYSTTMTTRMEPKPAIPRSASFWISPEIYNTRMVCCSIVSGKPTASIRERYADHVPPDYFTCQAVLMWVIHEVAKVEELNTTARSITCAWHNCSCSAPVVSWNNGLSRSIIYGHMSSTVTIDRQTLDVAPPLVVGLQQNTPRPDWLNGDLWHDWHGDNAKDFWAETITYQTSSLPLLNKSSISVSEVYMHDDILLDEASIIKTGRCIADEAYSWGFSSLLLLTFCCYTIAFALALILLQTDVYWNSRHDRDHQSHSIYADVLYLAEELKKTFGHNVEDHVRSPEAFDKRVEKWKQGLKLDVRELPLSRWQEWRQSQAAMHSHRKAKIASELRNMSPHDREKYSAVSVTMYDRLILGWRAKSNIEATSRSNLGTTMSGELVPSLAGSPVSTEGLVVEVSVHRDAAIELQDWAPQTRLPGLG